VARDAGRIPNARLSDSVRRWGLSVLDVAMAEWYPCCTGSDSGRVWRSADVRMCRCADVQMDRSAGSSEGMRPSLCVPNRAGVVGARRIQETGQGEGQRVERVAHSTRGSSVSERPWTPATMQRTPDGDEHRGAIYGARGRGHPAIGKGSRGIGRFCRLR
jgi:hypothetical protein